MGALLQTENCTLIVSDDVDAAPNIELNAGKTKIGLSTCHCSLFGGLAESTHLLMPFYCSVEQKRDIDIALQSALEVM
jgi:hypothetical protein